MLNVKMTTQDVYLVWDEPLGFAQTPATAGVAVYFYTSRGTWECQECGSAEKTTRGYCSHVLRCMGYVCQLQS